MKAFFFILFLSVLGASAQAQNGDVPASRGILVPVREPMWTYDVGAVAGSDQLGNYTEVQVGANWYQNQWLSWRNALFTRFGSDYDSIFGLDTSIRGELNFNQRNSGFGLQLYAGPGARFATRDSSAGFLEVGALFRVAKIYIGAGVKQMYYMQTREDRFGFPLPKEETQTSFILAGGGRF
ncbi:hypothetical protein [Bdellovibrio sp. HCB337]|uniref:hypothetical protein n=1 Tax=Bdellovibrio sp. HCB337 TaxID=3394358 RepID=UPI0039A49453